MEPIEFIHIFYYKTVWHTFFLLVTWITVLYYIGSNGQKLLYMRDSPSQVLAVFLSFLVIWYIGLRPISTEFADMWLYAYGFNAMEDTSYTTIQFGGEWLWNNIVKFCRNMGMNEYEYFLTIACGYVGFMFASAWVLVRRNLWMAVLFFFVAFSFFSYGTNGIRNGLGCSVELLALSLFAEKGYKRTAGLFMMFLAFGIHRSTILPSAAAIATLYFIRDTKTALRFWMASIAISLIAGPLMEQLFSALGFDDRMSSYSQSQLRDSDVFSHSGFRWDFLLYSFFPVAMIWYVTRHRKFADVGFTMMSNAYLLCNAFWIMVIRAAFSNRFAYLSWFLYPVVIFYPLLRMNLWEDQDRKTAIILFLYSGFTFYMFFIHYFGTTGFKGFTTFDWF